MSCVDVQGKDEVYDQMLLDYFLSYHQFIHLLCRVAINCEKFTDTLVKLSEYCVCACVPVCMNINSGVSSLRCVDSIRRTSSSPHSVP